MNSIPPPQFLSIQEKKQIFRSGSKLYKEPEFLFDISKKYLFQAKS